MAIYTRTGDRGETSLYSGERVDKGSLRVEAYGTLDELNSVLGGARALASDDKISSILEELQNQLFQAGADLATLSTAKHQVRRIQAGDCKALEGAIDDLQGELPRLKHFILPGGSPGACQLHLARSVCRRAERLICRLQSQEEEVNLDLLVYVNRLSDLLFVMARYENIRGGTPEVIWKPR